MVIEELLKATIEGLGTRGEVPVFPIQIFKVKDGVSYSEKDFEKAMKAENIEAAMTDSYEAPNFDLLLKACQTTAKALFPNFMFLDTPFNQNEKWKATIRSVTFTNWQQWAAVPVFLKMWPEKNLL